MIREDGGVVGYCVIVHRDDSPWGNGPIFIRYSDIRGAAGNSLRGAVGKAESWDDRC